MSKVRIGIVGLGIGAEFIPIYQNHPDAAMVGICRRDKDSRTRNKIGEALWHSKALQPLCGDA
ncbi:MAG: hypothetical protein JJU00_19190 [Opitutales bacterium]|nr:hypothetical protein [Opitutales bacterium]